MTAAPNFSESLREHGIGPLLRHRPTTVQINVGKLCNQACHHCHVDAGPKRSERMARATAECLVGLVENDPAISTVDITGGAPELNENFVYLVRSLSSPSRRVIDRCNLTVIYAKGMGWLPAFLAEHRVELVCSLPCYTADNTDSQRGQGVFEASIRALGLLNGLGYGRPGSGLRLDLVYNPLGPTLPPDQAELESRYRSELDARFGISFNSLFTITNMPISRFAEQLRRSGQHESYLGLLVNHFNPATVEGLMCRELVSVGWQGSLYDCDFNQMLEIPLAGGGRYGHIDDLDNFGQLAGLGVATAEHCYGCTAGAGSSCSGELTAG